jgi:hypothetical protein
VNAFYSLSAHYGVNLVNFMDGLDWMTVVEVVPITAALAAIGLLGYIPCVAEEKFRDRPIEKGKARDNCCPYIILPTALLRFRLALRLNPLPQQLRGEDPQFPLFSSSARAGSTST